ncbi:MAG: F0F1 ATP synthase subunit B [Candidatus Pacebacteria bacterium]|nr:F0F1 ATP synthase subunit B [Candidatus Paceibacterota bacterium]
MESILHTFGIDWRLLAINMVNFGLLMLGLWYFLYGPVMKMLEDRRQKVAKGVEDAEAAGRARQEIEGERSAVLSAAAQEADEALARARAAASARERELVEEAGRRAESIVAQAEAQAREEKAKAIADSKDEVAKLIVLGMEKVMKK